MIFQLHGLVLPSDKFLWPFWCPGQLSQVLSAARTPPFPWPVALGVVPAPDGVSAWGCGALDEGVWLELVRRPETRWEPGNQP